MARVLVTGGCGFIGSHTVVDLIEKGHEVVSLDNMYNAHENAQKGIEAISNKPFKNHQIDLRDKELVREMLESEIKFDAVIHFAAMKSVGESMEIPLTYFDNNVRAMMNLLELCVEFEIPKFVFSSSCTVYGQPDIIPVTEESPLKRPTSPYGTSKLICETMLMDIAERYPFIQAVILRYFNPAGAHDSLLIGESAKQVATNLVPIIAEVAAGHRKKLYVHGNDYPTRDGSCLRDYIHVMDLADAHTKALDFINSGQFSGDWTAFNLAMGEGVTVLEAIKAFEESCSIKLNYEIGPRRKGDVAKIYADYEKARTVLNWHPKKSIEDIMTSAWKFDQA